MENIGYATVSVIPVMRGIQAELTGQMAGPATAAGAASGRKAGAAMAAEVAKTKFSFTGLQSAALAASSALVVGGLKNMSDQFATASRETLKFQRLTGASAEDSSRLRVVAQQTGTSVDQLATAFVRLSRSSQSAGGAEMFAKLGVNLNDAEGAARPLSGVLVDLADKFKDMPSGAEKNALALQLFGRAGADLLPLLNRGAAGIDAIIKKSDELGLTLTDADLSGVKDYTAASRDLSLAWQGLQIQVGKNVFPVITSSMESAASAAKSLAGFVDDLPEPVKTVGTDLALLSATAGVVFGGGGLLIKGVQGAASAWGGLASRISTSVSSFAGVDSAAAGAAGSAGRLGNAMSGIALGVGAVAGVIALGEALDHATTNSVALRTSMDRFAAADNGAEAFDQLIEQTRILDGGFRDLWQLGADNPFVHIGRGAEQLNVDVNMLSQAMREAADAGNFESLRLAIEEIERRGVSAAGMSWLGSGDQGDVDRVNSLLKLMKERISAAGEADKKRKESADASSQAILNQAASIDVLNTALDKSASTAKLASVQQAGLAAAARAFSQAIQDSTSLDDQVAAAVGFNDALGKVHQSMAALPKALDIVDTAFRDTGEGIGALRRKALTDLAGLGEQARNLMQSFVSAGDTDGARRIAERLREDLTFQLDQQGLDPEQVRQYLGLAGLTDEQINIAVTMSGDEDARVRLGLLRDFVQSAGIPESPGRTRLEAKVAAVIAEGGPGSLSQAAALYSAWVTDIQDGAIDNPIIQAVVADPSAATERMTRFHNDISKDPIIVPVDADTSFMTSKIGKAIGNLFGSAGLLSAAQRAQSGGVDGDPSTPFATGGYVYGTGRQDSVSAVLTPGEYVMTADTVKRLGSDYFAALNRGANPAPAQTGGGATINVHYDQVERAPSASDLVRTIRSAEYLRGHR